MPEAEKDKGVDITEDTPRKLCIPEEGREVIALLEKGEEVPEHLLDRLKTAASTGTETGTDRQRVLEGLRKYTQAAADRERRIQGMLPRSSRKDLEEICGGSWMLNVPVGKEAEGDPLIQSVKKAVGMLHTMESGQEDESIKQAYNSLRAILDDQNLVSKLIEMGVTHIGMSPAPPATGPFTKILKPEECPNPGMIDMAIRDSGLSIGNLEVKERGKLSKLMPWLIVSLEDCSAEIIEKQE